MRPAYDDAVALLARRPLTEREVVERLRAKGHDDPAIEAAVARLCSSRAIDDGALARQWIETQAATRGRGRERCLAALEARGIDAAVAAAAWREAIDEGALDESDALARAVRRRLGAAPSEANRGRLARVYNALLHEGFEPGAIEAALRPYGFEGTDS